MNIMKLYPAVNRIVLSSFVLVLFIAPAVSQENGRDGLEIFDPVVQYQTIIDSVDYFDQFLWGDDIFERYLLQLFAVERTAFEPGAGIVLESRRDDSVTRIERALLSVDDREHRWWRLSIENEDRRIYLEVFTAPTGMPLEVRYVHPETGLYHTREPVVSYGYGEAAESAGENVMAAAIEEMISSSVDRMRHYLLRDPQFIGSETVETGAGSFRASHFTAAIEGGSIDYWLSLEIPGGLLRMTVTAESGETVRDVGLVELTDGNVSRFSGSELIPDSNAAFTEEEPYEIAWSEGTPDEPVVLSSGAYHDGSVAEGETSYYAVYVPKRCDVEIMVFGHTGGLEIYSFDADASFTDWTNASSGFEPAIQDYYVESGSYRYFSIVDIADRDGYGELYTIGIEPLFVLDPIGISIRGDFPALSEELNPGTHTITLGGEALMYFRTLAAGGGTLRISARNLPPGAGLRWFDTHSKPYGSSSWSAGPAEEIVEVSGLQPGTVCYFYIAGEPDSDAADAAITLRVDIHGE